MSGRVVSLINLNIGVQHVIDSRSLVNGTYKVLLKKEGEFIDEKTLEISK